MHGMLNKVYVSDSLEIRLLLSLPLYLSVVHAIPESVMFSIRTNKESLKRREKTDKSAHNKRTKTNEKLTSLSIIIAF